MKICLNNILILLATCITTTMQGATIDVARLMQFGLPVMNIETLDHKMPTAEYAAPPQGCIGNGIKNAEKVSGTITLYYNKTAIYNDRMTIKVRGNTSALSDKKSFGINLPEKADLLNMGGTHKDKHWALIKDEDQKLFPVIGFKICELLGLQWTPKYQYVNVMLNGQYWGLYILVETVERNDECRLDVNKSTGYIIEYDPYWWNEKLYFKSRLSQNYTFKYPDYDDMLQSQVDYIANTMLTVENSILYGQNYPQYIDVESFALWLIGHDILGTWDSGGSNMFMTKYNNAASTKVMMANMWDFDTIESTKNAWSNIHSWNGFYFSYLFNNKNKEFQNTYIKKYKELSSTIFDNIISFLNDFASSKEAGYINMSRVLDSDRWNTSTLYSVADNAEESIEWFTTRKTWLDNAINKMDYTTNIKNINIANENHDNHIYDLMGNRVNGNRKGIFIYQGKKILIK